MFKLIIICFVSLFICFQSPAGAYSKLYIGEEKGEFFAGIEAGVDYGGIKLKYDILSSNIKPTKISVSPEFITYKITFEFSDTAIYYQCKHAVDMERDRDYVNKIGITYWIDDFNVEDGEK